MKKIEYLETPLGRVADQKGMMDVALDFYKKLFAEKPGGGASLGHNFWIDADKVKTEENDLLVAPFFWLKRLKMLSLVAIQMVPLVLMGYLFFSTKNSWI
jgi:hypothetical protein